MSVGGGYKQIPANALYINLIAAQSTVVDSNNVTVSWASAPAAGPLSTPGAAVLRDMGQNIYLPNPNVPTSVGSQSTVLRKVQLVTRDVNGYYGTGNSGTSGTEYYTGYIRLGGQTYGGGNGIPSGFVRLN